MLRPLLALPLALLVYAPRVAAQSPTRARPTLTPTLAAQVRFTASGVVDGDLAEPVLELRRLRPGLRVSAFDNRLSAQVTLNTTPSALEVIDAWAEYALTPSLRLRGGQTKQPFTAYRLRSFTELAFVDWALVTRAFGGERQLGFELHDRGSSLPVEFSVGVWNGTTMRAAHGQGVAGVYAEAVENLSDLRAVHLPDAPHPEITGRVAWRSARERAVRVDLGLSATVDLRPVTAHDFRTSLAPEAAISVGPLTAELTGYVGLAELSERPDAGVLAGVLGELRARVHDRVTVGLRYARVESGDDLRADARARAERIILESAMDQRTVVQRRYADAGRVRYEQELTAGVVVRLLGTTLAWQSDFGWLRTERDVGARDELRGRTQLQVMF